MNDPTLAANLTATTRNLESLTDRLNKGEGTVGKLLNDDALYKRLDAMTGAARHAGGSPQRRARAPPASCCRTNSYMRT